MPPESSPSLTRRTIRGWCMYDWANSAYVTTSAGALLPSYFVLGVAPDGVELFGRAVPPAGLWAAGVGVSALVVFILAPVLGAIADYRQSKLRFLRAFAFSGALFGSLLFFAVPGAIWFTLTMFVFAQICFTAGNVFYDAFLPSIASDAESDRVSARGFSYGYIGGGWQFALALGLVAGHEALGLDRVMAIRLSLLMAGLWWFGFSALAFRWMRAAEDAPAVAGATPPPSGDVQGYGELARLGISRTLATARRLPRFRNLMLFLIAFLLYNDGIQTVIGQASAYASGELGLDTVWVMVTFLIVQFVAVGGAFVFSRLAERIGTKPAVMAALAGWTVVVTFAYFIPRGSVVGFMTMGAAVGIVMGGAQALSRSLYAVMIPKEASAEFFGFFSVFGKLSAVVGPFLFAGLTFAFGSARPAILAMIVFFVLGMALLWRVDLDKAKEERDAWSFDGDDVAVDPSLA